MQSYLINTGLYQRLHSVPKYFVNSIGSPSDPVCFPLFFLQPKCVIGPSQLLTSLLLIFGILGYLENIGCHGCSFPFLN